MNKLNVIDLFAGCGGITEGFEQSGKYETIACVEWDKNACRTLEHRLNKKWGYTNANYRVLRFDLRRTNELLVGWKNDEKYGSSNGLNEIVDNSNGVDLIIGGPPCQAYSIAGRIRDEHGMRYDFRNYLFESYLRVVERFRPKLVIFENVPGILSASPGNIPIWTRISKGFDAIGYEMVRKLRENALVDLTLFGVPQNRKRVFIMALNRNVFGNKSQNLMNDFFNKILPKYHSSKLETVKDAIYGMPKFMPAKKECRIKGRKYSHTPHKSNVPNHYPRYHNKRDISIFRLLAQDIRNEEEKYTSIEELKKLYTLKTGKTSNVHKYYVLRWGEPSNTIPAHLYKDGLRHIHPDPEQARSITVREAAELQTFPDDFVFLGAMTHQYKMIGNAVPPKFSKILANAIFNFLYKVNDK